MQTLRNNSDYQKKLLNQNSIHLDSKWVKQTIPITGSAEASLILSDCIIYHRNRYRSFMVDNQQRYGLLTSLREIQRNYNISYKRAKKVIKDLGDKNLVEIHKQGFVYNQKFYTPTDKALNVFDQLHWQRHMSLSHGKTKNKVILPANQDTIANQKISYEDENKTLKNSKSINRKNNNTLKNKKKENIKTVIFDFTRFNFGKIVCEKSILDYFTIRQVQGINIITYCYRDILDIMIFNHMLYRSDLKKEAKDFKQLVTWAYIKAKKRNVVLPKKEQNLAECNNNSKIQVTNPSAMQFNTREATSDDIITHSKKDHNAFTAISELTSKDIRTMILEKKSPSSNSFTDKAQIKSDSIDIIPIKPVVNSSSKSQYLLNLSNQLYLLEELSEKGIDDARLIMQTAEEITKEYPRVVFNDLLNGVIHRLCALPSAHQQEKATKKILPMIGQASRLSASNITEDKNTITIQNYKYKPSKIVKAYSAGLLKKRKKNIIETYKKNTRNLNKKERTTFTSYSFISKKNKQSLIYVDNTKILEKTTHREIKALPINIFFNFLNRKNQRFLFDRLNNIGIINTKLVVEAVGEIAMKYSNPNYQVSAEGFICQAFNLFFKEKNKVQTYLKQPFLKYNYTVNQQELLKVIRKKEKNTSKLEHRKDYLLQGSSIMTPNMIMFCLPQNWRSKVEHAFSKDLLLNKQKSGENLIQMIFNYVEGKIFIMSFIKEIYERLFCTIGNKCCHCNIVANSKCCLDILMQQWT